MALKQGGTVIPIRRDVAIGREDQQLADWAYDLWLGWAFRGGSPEDALWIAVHEASPSHPAYRAARPFLVPKRNGKAEGAQRS